MRTIYKILLVLVIPICSSAQKFTTGGLLEKKDIGGSPVFYQKSSPQKCNGYVCGYVIPRHTKLGCVDIVASFLQVYYFDHNIPHNIPFWDVAICVEGFLSKGKEVGDWHLFISDKPIFSTVSFDKNDTITMTISINDSIIFHGSINNKDRCRKKNIKYIHLSCLKWDHSADKFLKHDEIRTLKPEYLTLAHGITAAT